MYIIVIAWIYVVFMMAITETSVVAGIMTFLLYGVLPVAILVYLMDSGRRRRKRKAQEMQRREEAIKQAEAQTSQPPPEN
jgi:bacteriorhodopsin